jgi:hypothetical protein
MAGESEVDMKYVDIVFDGPPGPVAGRFVEVEDATGASIRIGEWVQDGDLWRLRIPDPRENAALRQSHANILALLNPFNPEETIEGAIRNLQQALLSEQGNVADEAVWNEAWERGREYERRTPHSLGCNAAWLASKAKASTERT